MHQWYCFLIFIHMMALNLFIIFAFIPYSALPSRNSGQQPIALLLIVHLSVLDKSERWKLSQINSRSLSGALNLLLIPNHYTTLFP